MDLNGKNINDFSTNETFSDTTDFIHVQSTLTGQDTSGTYNNVKVNSDGKLQAISGKQTIFGETIIAPYTPVFQNYSPYGIISDQLYTKYTATGGTVSANDDGVEVDYNITTSVGSYAILRSKKVLKYRPGFSNLIRTSARFDTPVANSLQFSGVGNAGSDLYFAYNGTDFGVRHSTGGLGETRMLTLTAAATGIETATITVNDVVFTANLTNALGTIAFSAHQVETGATYTGWNIEHIGNTIVFSGGSVGSRAGTYSFSSATAVGTFSQIMEGAALTTINITQANWNGDSTMKTLLDPTKNNLYEIEYSWFGSSNIYFRVYNPYIGLYETVHTLTFANVNTAPSMNQPNLYYQHGLASLGSTTAMTNTSTCALGCTTGIIDLRYPISSYFTSKAIASGVETNILVIKNRNTVNGYANQSEIYITKMTIINESNKPTIIKITRNPTSTSADIVTDYNAYTYVNQTQSLILTDVVSNTYTGGQVLETFYVNKDGSLTLNFEFRLQMYQSEEFVISALAGAIATVSISVGFIEDL